MSETSPKNPQSLAVGVRDLIQALYRKGGLSSLQYSELTARQGTRTHQAFFNLLDTQYLQFRVERELTLSYNWSNPDPEDDFIKSITVRGRADILLTPQEDSRAVSLHDFGEKLEEPLIMEVKTVASALDLLPEDGEIMHWYQARMYTYLYYKTRDNSPPEKVTYALAYVSAETLEARYYKKEESFRDLEKWFDQSLRDYLKLARSIRFWWDKRNRSIDALSFPYPNLRAGQRSFIEHAYKAIEEITPFLAQAPTGIGKTMSALYPAIKQLRYGHFDHIFYLTAKRSTRLVAENALEDLRKHSHLALKQITLRAKEQMCLRPDLYCDTALCPYASKYYDNLPRALNALGPLEVFHPETLLKAGEQYKLCPFELSLDLALYCDLIIGDYNHAFDPRIQLERFFGQGSGSQILLVDEAHNLVDRARDMYSATLETQAFQTLLDILPESDRFHREPIQAILNYLNDLSRSMNPSATPGEDNSSPGDLSGEKTGSYWLELENNKSMRLVQDRNFLATTAPPKVLSGLLLNWLRESRDLFDLIEDPKARRRLVEIIGQAKFFTRIIEDLWSGSYVACVRQGPTGLAIRLICLDISDKISKTYMNKHASVFFSATLEPISYFAGNFCGKSRDNRPDTLSLPSPFPPENLEVYICPFIETTYRERRRTSPDLAKALALAILLKKGQQLIFFPSFAYMNQVLPLLQKMLSGQNIEWQIQKSAMTSYERKAFLEAFDKPSEGKTLIGLAVLGGVFSEGIDLVGEKLTGVSIVGVGTPQISPERNIMAQYYDQEYRAGFAYAYQYPGMNKVLQAAGRLIRSEEDKGFLLLFDARYSRPNYRQLLPEEWMTEEVRNLKELKDYLSPPPPAE